MQVAPIVDPSSVADPHLALRKRRDKVAGTSSCWQFTSAAQSISFAWCLNTRSGSDYVRELLRITAGSTDAPIAEVRLMQFADAGARVEGSVKGSPVVDANLFFGLEHPLSVNAVEGGVVRASLFRDLPLRAGAVDHLLGSDWSLAARSDAACFSGLSRERAAAGVRAISALQLVVRPWIREPVRPSRST